MRRHLALLVLAFFAPSASAQDFAGKSLLENGARTESDTVSLMLVALAPEGERQGVRLRTVDSEVAALLAERGDRLYLVGRNTEKLAALVDALGAAVAGHAVCDLDELEANEARVAAAVDRLGGLDVALIAHGYLGDQIRSEREHDYARQVIRTNFTSAVSLLIPLANFFEQQGHGHLAAITSVAGERGRPRNYTYGASKGALTRYLQGLRSRLYSTGVCVHNIKLGPVDTPMSAGHDQNFLWGEKKRVARGIVRALDGRRHVHYLPWSWCAVMGIVRALPEALFQRFGFLAGR